PPPPPPAEERRPAAAAGATGSGPRNTGSANRVAAGTRAGASAPSPPAQTRNTSRNELHQPFCFLAGSWA
ncbi:hypothetical protein GA0115261_111337, partial [Streptomyces sp. OspMP-M43]